MGDKCPVNASLTSGSPQSHSSPSSTYPFPHFWPPKDCFTSGRLNRHMPMPFSRLASRSFLLQLLNIMGNGNLREGGRMSVAREQNGLCILLVPGCVVAMVIIWADGHSLSEQKLDSCKMRHLQLHPALQSCTVPAPLNEEVLPAHSYLDSL